MITPANSVLSAVEGLKLDAPALAPLVLPITLVILLALSFEQRRSTALIGSFSTRSCWCGSVIGLLGLAETVRAPAVLAALDPRHALGYLLHAGPAIGLLFGILVHAGEIQDAGSGSDEGPSAKFANSALFD